MPLSLLSSSKRPTPLGWLMLALLLLACLSFIRTISLSSSSRRLLAEQTNFIPSSVLAVPSSAMNRMDGAGIGVPASPPAPSAAPGEGMAQADKATSHDSASPASNERIIKTGDLRLRVVNVSEALDQIKYLASTRQGFIERSSRYDAAGTLMANATLRVPAASFDASLNDLKRIAETVLQENIQGQNVSMDFIDLEADLRNAKAEEASYLEILKRSGAIDDVLAVTQRLADVRGRIERLEGRKRYLEQQTDLATITVSLTEEARIEVPGKTWKIGEITRSAIRDLVTALQEVIALAIRIFIGLLGLVLPLLLLIALLLWLGWKTVRSILRRFRN